MNLLSRLLVVLVASLSLTGTAGAVPPLSVNGVLGQQEAEVLFAMQIKAWELACEVKRAKCDQIVPPLVGYGILFGALGQYRHGSDAVMVDIRLITLDLSILVMVHEMIHYIQYGEGRMDADSPNFRSSCDREKEAFELTHKVNRKENIVDSPHIVGWDKAKERYPACRMKELATGEGRY